MWDCYWWLTLITWDHSHPWTACFFWRCLNLQDAQFPCFNQACSAFIGAVRRPRFLQLCHRTCRDSWSFGAGPGGYSRASPMGLNVVWGHPDWELGMLLCLASCLFFVCLGSWRTLCALLYACLILLQLAQCSQHFDWVAKANSYVEVRVFQEKNSVKLDGLEVQGL